LHAKDISPLFTPPGKTPSGPRWKNPSDAHDFTCKFVHANQQD